MPHELTFEEITDKILARTLVVYTKRSGDHVKYKLRTKKTLYTIKTTPEEASEMEAKIKNAGNIEIIPL